MDLRRFLDLYVSETQEHVRLLHRSLLALEQEAERAAAVDEAFRAAHTLKGLSAAMGYTAVAGLAHTLEDRLDGVRAGGVVVDSDLIDAMLAEADALESAIAEAVTRAPAGGDGGTGATGAAGAAASDAVEAGTPASRPNVGGAVGHHAPTAAPDTPAGVTSVARVRLRADAAIKSARAMLVMKAVEAMPGVLGSDPATFADDDFDGEFRIFLGADADPRRVEDAIVAAGDVDSVEISEGARSTASARPAPQAPQPAPSPERQVRVDTWRLDAVAEHIGELSVLFGRMPAGTRGRDNAAEMLTRMGSLLAQLQQDVLALRMVPLREAFERLPRVVRDAARSLERDVELVLAGDDVQIDRAILEEVGEPLVHLLRNAVDHGIEDAATRQAAGKPARGRITVTAERERSSVRITIADDGAGVRAARVAARARETGLLPADAGDELDGEELFRLLSHPGLSTAEQLSQLSGRGVGMDVVFSRVRALGGAIDMHTVEGQGTTFSIRLPITLALAQALRVRIGGEDYAIPLTHVVEAVELDSNTGADHGTVDVRGTRLPVVRLRQMLQVEGSGSEDTAIIAERGERRAALAVDELVGREQIVVKSFDSVAGMLPYFSGATLLADGRPVLVLDPLSVI